MRRRSETVAGADQARVRVELELLAARVLDVQRRFHAAVTRAIDDAARFVAEQTRDLQVEFLEANKALLAAADAAGLVTRMEWDEDGQLHISFHAVGSQCEPWGPQLYLDPQQRVIQLDIHPKVLELRRRSGL